MGSTPGHLTKELNISSRCNSIARDLPVVVVLLLLLLVMVHQIVVHLIPPGIAWILSLASDWPAWISCCRWREVSFQMQPLPAGSQVRKSTQITSFAKGCKQWQHSLRLSFESPDNADALLTFPRFGSAPNFCNAQANFPVYCQPVILVWFILYNTCIGLVDFLHQYSWGDWKVVHCTSLAMALFSQRGGVGGGGRCQSTIIPRFRCLKTPCLCERSFDRFKCFPSPPNQFHRPSFNSLNMTLFVSFKRFLSKAGSVLQAPTSLSLWSQWYACCI